MISRAPTRSSWLVVSLSICACAGEGQSDRDVVTDIRFTGDAPDVQPDVDVHESYAFVDLCDRWAEACCHVLTCEGSSPEDELTLCVDTQREVCDHDIGTLLQSHLDLGALAYSPANAEACWAPVIAAACGEVSEVTPATECGDIVLGTAAVGAACAFDAICAPGLFCAPGVDGTCPGTCQDRVADGEVCDTVHALCREGSRCLSTFTTGLDDDVCGAMNVAVGGACVADTQCQPDGYCDAGAGTCAARLGAGGACDRAAQCAPGSCAPDTHTCGPPPVAGEACETLCADGFVCLRNEHTCVAAPTLGQPCRHDAIFVCGLGVGLQCDPGSDTCVGPLALGAPCGGPSAPTWCAHGYCSGDFTTAGTCQPEKAVGAACDGPEECGSFLTCKADGTCGLYGDPCRGAPLNSLW